MNDRPTAATRAPVSVATAPPASPAGVRLRRVPLPVVLGLMLVAGLCALLALNTASAAQELKQRALTDQNATTSDAEQQLMRDLAARQAPAALAAAAQAQGLVPNPNPAFLRLNADGSVTVLGSPMPASVPPPPVTPTTPKPTPSVTKPTPSATKSAKASASPHRPAGSSSAHASAAPVVTVTVTRAAPTTHAARPSATPTATRRP